MGARQTKNEFCDDEWEFDTQGAADMVIDQILKQAK